MIVFSKHNNSSNTEKIPFETKKAPSFFFHLLPKTTCLRHSFAIMEAIKRDDRRRVVGKFLSKFPDIKCAEVVRRFEPLGMSPPTIRRIHRRFKEGKSMERETGQGRKFKHHRTLTEDRKNIAEFALEKGVSS